MSYVCIYECMHSVCVMSNSVKIYLSTVTDSKKRQMKRVGVTVCVCIYCNMPHVVKDPYYAGLEFSFW